MFQSLSQKIFLVSIVGLTAIVIANIAHQWGFPDTRFPLEKSEKVKLDETGAMQTFIATRNELSGINILFGGSQTKNGGTLSIALLNASCQEKIIEQKGFTTSFDTENSFRFSFPPISDSKGKTFCLTTHFAPAKGSKKAAIFVTTNTLPQEALSLSINGEMRPNESLSFRPVYRNKTLLADFVEINQRISQYKPWFLKGITLAVITILSIGLTLIFLILAITKDSAKESSREK
ncbi:MAG: hypothetical protein WAU31_00625 [Candidatus Moraniibacteriota bacterium]